MRRLNPHGNSFIVEMITVVLFFLTPLKPSSSLEGPCGFMLKTPALDFIFSIFII